MRPHLAVAAAALLAAGVSLPACGHSLPATAPPGGPAGAAGAPTLTPATGAGAPTLTSATGAGAPTLTAATGTSPGPTVTTVGTGTVTGTPDEMTVTIGVQATGIHAADALQEDNARARAVQAALMRDGVGSADMQTSDLSLYQQDPSSGGGYQAQDTITATLRQLGSAGAAIDDAIAAAGDAGRLEGVSFAFSDDSSLLARARQAAVADARAQAEQLAAAAGDTLGGLVSLSESQPAPGPYPMPLAGGVAASASSPAPVPVQPGTPPETGSV